MHKSAFGSALENEIRHKLQRKCAAHPPLKSMIHISLECNPLHVYLSPTEFGGAYPRVIEYSACLVRD